VFLTAHIGLCATAGVSPTTLAASDAGVYAGCAMTVHLMHLEFFRNGQVSCSILTASKVAEHPDTAGHPLDTGREKDE
jgi:hypothetical protein